MRHFDVNAFYFHLTIQTPGFFPDHDLINDQGYRPASLAIYSPCIREQDWGVSLKEVIEQHFLSHLRFLFASVSFCPLMITSSRSIH